MDVYVIHAFDEIYGGLHGMEMWSLEEFNNESEATDVAEEMSCDIIDSYSDITDILKERAEDLLSYDIEEGRIHSAEEQEKYFNQYYEECVGEDISFSITKLDPKYTIEQYNEMILSQEYDYEELADKFGVEEY